MIISIRTINYTIKISNKKNIPICGNELLKMKSERTKGPLEQEENRPHTNFHNNSQFECIIIGV